jgi:GGDEF domain-containing protein
MHRIRNHRPYLSPRRPGYGGQALCRIGGEQFATKIPNTHLGEVDQALAHGEVLLMIDIPKRSWD